MFVDNSDVCDDDSIQKYISKTFYFSVYYLVFFFYYIFVIILYLV